MTARILAVDDNAVNLKVISATLARGGFEVMTATAGPAALETAERELPQMIILDVGMPDMDGYEVCRRLRSNPRTALIPIIILTAHDSLEEKIKGVEAGADDFLTKPFQPVELQARIKNLLRNVTSPPTSIQTSYGKAIAVYSLRGGVGVSSIAANIAGGMALLWNYPTVLVDLAFPMGQSALMYNLPLKNSWDDLVGIPTDDLEINIIEKNLLHHSSNLYILACPGRYDQLEYITGEKVKKVLRLLLSKYQYVIVDLPHDLQKTTLAGLDIAQEILLVLSAELASLRAAARALEIFDHQGYPKTKIRLVLNQLFEYRAFSRKDIELALKMNIDLTIPFASDTFISSLDSGTPPVIGSPTSAIASVFEDYAYVLSKEEHQRQKPDNPSDIWKRVFGRLVR